MCEVKYKFGIKVNEKLSIMDDNNIVSDNMEQWIVDYMDDNNDLFIPIEEYGITEEDINNPKYYTIVGGNEDITDMFVDEHMNVRERVIKLYRYILYPDAPNTGGYSGGIGPNTRPFCRELIRRSSLSLLTKDSIERLNTANPGFGIRGANSYSVFNWRGGVSCKHVWVRYLFQPSTGNLIEDTKQPTQTSPGNVPRYDK